MPGDTSANRSLARRTTPLERGWRRRGIILRRVLKPKLITVFIGVVGTGILIVGYLFNVLF